MISVKILNFLDLVAKSLLKNIYDPVAHEICCLSVLEHKPVRNFVSERNLRFCIEFIQKMNMLQLYSLKFAKNWDFGSKSVVTTPLSGF